MNHSSYWLHRFRNTH